MKHNTPGDLFLRLMKNAVIKIKPDANIDYIDYDHLTGDKVFHGRIKKIINEGVPYFKVVNEIRIQDNITKLENLIRTTYHTVDDQSVNETIIDVDTMASIFVDETITILSFKSILYPISDSVFNQLVGKGEITLEKTNIEFNVLEYTFQHPIKA